MRTASRSIGGVAIRLISRTPLSAICSVRGSGRRQREHVHVALQLLQTLLVRDPEVLLLIDDQQAQVAELELLGEQGVRTDDDVDRAVSEPGLGLLRVLRGDQPRQLADAYRQAGEAIAEGSKVLSAEQGGRHHHRDLPAVHCGYEGGAQRHLGLAETDIAADQPVGRPAAAQVLEHVADGARLIFGLGPRKPGAELVEQTFGRRETRRFPNRPSGGDANQLGRHLAQALLHPRLTGLPAGPAEPVESDALAIRAEAADHLDILDRKVEAVAVGVEDTKAIVRRAIDRHSFKAVVAADAVVDVHDEIAGRKRRGLDQEILGPRAAGPAPHHTLAQNVLLGDGEVLREEAAIEGQDRQSNRPPVELACFGPRLHRPHVGDLVLAQHRCQPIARAATDGGDEDALSGGVMLGQPLGQRIENVYVGPPARLRKVHSHVTAGIDDRLPFGRRPKRTEDADGVPRQHRIPGVGIEEQATDRHRSVRHSRVCKSAAPRFRRAA